MQFSIKELRENIQFCLNTKYQVSIGMKRMIQDDIEMFEQCLQTILPNEELVRLSPSGEMLNGYAKLPPDEKTPDNITVWDLLKPNEHGFF
jgi:hypothetical protein